MYAIYNLQMFLYIRKVTAYKCFWRWSLVNFTQLYPQYYKKKESPKVYTVTAIDNKLQTDIEKVKDTFTRVKPAVKELKHNVKKLDLSSRHNRHIMFNALSPLSPIRRISSLEDNIHDGNYVRAIGLVGLAAMNLPEDCNDLKLAYNQIIKNRKPSYNPKLYQHKFSFFRGTLLEPLLALNGKYGKKISDFLYVADRPIYDTKFGKWMGKVCNVKQEDAVQTSIKDIQGTKVLAIKHKGSTFSRMVGRGMLRLPVLSVYALGALELPAIIKNFTKKDSKNNIKDGFKQIAKSTTYVVSLLSGIGLVGALIARKGPAGSLVGIGLGSVAGSFASKYVNKQIEKV